MRVLCLSFFASIVLVNSQPSEECQVLMSECTNAGTAQETCRQQLRSLCAPTQGGGGNGGNSGNNGTNNSNNSNGEETQHESDSENMDPAGVWKVANMEECVVSKCDFQIHPSANEGGRGGRRLARRLAGEAREGWNEEIFAGDFNHSFVGRPSSTQLKCICEECGPIIEKQLQTLHCSPPGMDEDGNFRTEHEPCDLEDDEATEGAEDLAELLLGGICPNYDLNLAEDVFDPTEIESGIVTGWTATTCDNALVEIAECEGIESIESTDPCDTNPFVGLTKKEVKKLPEVKSAKKVVRKYNKLMGRLEEAFGDKKQTKKIQRKINKLDLDAANDVLDLVRAAKEC